MKDCKKHDSIFLPCDLGYAQTGLDSSLPTDLQAMSQRAENFCLNILHSSRYDVLNFLVTPLTFLQDVPANDVEYSELILYHIDFLEEQGDLGEALAMLHQYTESGVIMNRLHTATVRPRLLLKLGRTDEAIEAYRALVDRNPDCYESYRDLLKSQDIDLGGSPAGHLPRVLTLLLDALTEEITARALRLLDDLTQKYPKALVPQRLALKISSGDDFSRRVKEYMLRGLMRNVPSLFVDIKPLYADTAKREVVEKLIETYCERLEANQGLDSDGRHIPSVRYPYRCPSRA
jgi:tetratricopeptide (TPR) repeat protein